MKIRKSNTAFNRVTLHQTTAVYMVITCDNLNSYANLFRKCVNIDSSQYNWFNNKEKDKLFLIHFNICSLQKQKDEINTY